MGSRRQTSSTIGGENHEAEENGKNNDSPPASPIATPRSITIRNLTAFWLFGLCNNFAYVIMLSAAEDILSIQENNGSGGGNGSNGTSHSVLSPDDACLSNSTNRHCNPISTGAVLLADILPTLIIKLTAPFYMEHIPYGLRNVIVVGSQVASYLFVAFSTSVGMSIFGVVCASFGSGLGEIMFLSMSVYFDKNVISTWSSGTGGAGVLGSFAYAGIRQLGVSARNTVLIMLVVPVLMAGSYWILLVIPDEVPRCSILDPRSWIVSKKRVEAEHSPIPPTSTDQLVRADDPSSVLINKSAKLTVGQKLRLILPLLKYMIPLGMVYSFEYFINQGLQELVVFHCTWLNRSAQYRWYQVLYQVGVMVSRSSVNLIQIPAKFLPILTIIQGLNMIVFLTNVLYVYIPSIWIVFGLILIEGLCGGAAYVNTFYGIRKLVAEEVREFSLGVASLADSMGIVIAALSSIPVHNALCSTPLPTSRRY